MQQLGITCDAITADYRILQRRKGHRFSLDDLVTAWEAAQALPSAQSCLDLGCGIGSVLLMLAWRLSHARLFGIEAQEVSVSLARRSVELNHLTTRVTVLEGDLRSLTENWPHVRCELVTGTPPYLPTGSALPSPDPQRAAARLELRGGVEDYLAAAARVLAPGGRVVVCFDGRYPLRVFDGAEAAGLAVLRRRDIVARGGAATPLLSVWTLGSALSGAPPVECLRLDVRERAGPKTPQAQALRQFFGLPDSR